MSLGWSLAAVPVLIAMNAFFVAGEYAVVALRPAQVDAMRRRGRRATAAAMERLKANPASAIGTIQVCITMTNLMLGWIGEPAMSAVLRVPFGPLIERWPATFTAVSTGLSFVVVTLLTVVLSELLPKALTLRYAEAAAVLTAAPMAAVQRAVRPLVWVMNTMADAVTRPLGLGSVDDLERQRMTVDELQLMAVQAAEDGVVTPRERSVILNTLAMGRRTARQIMVPRMRVTYLDLRRSMDDNRRVLNEYLHSRLPLCDGGMDRVVGVVHVKEFLAAYNEGGDTSVLSLLCHPAHFVPENATLDRLLAAFHERRSQLIFLVDEYGGVEGIVTLQDVVDELIGEIVEPPAEPRGTANAAAAAASSSSSLSSTPRSPAALAASTTLPPAAPLSPVMPATDDGTGASVEVPGETPLHELARQLGRPEWPAPTGVATVAGLVVAHLNRIPRPGEALEIDNTRFRVTASDGRAVRSVTVEAIDGGADGAGGANGAAASSA